jgi:hypothetical protein
VGEPEGGERTGRGPTAVPNATPGAPPPNAMPGELPDPMRRRLDEIFGDVLPDATRDEQPDAAEQPPAAGDEWLRANRPPHHGG